MTKLRAVGLSEPSVASAAAQRKATLKHFLDDHYASWLIADNSAGREELARLKQAFAELLAIPLEDLRLRRIDRYRIDAIDRGEQPKSINKKITQLQSVLTHALDLGLITTHPLTALIPLRDNDRPRPRVLSEAEERALLAALTERDLETKFARAVANQRRASTGLKLLPDLSQGVYVDPLTPMVMLSLKAGLRKSELFDLRWCDIDFEGRLISVSGGELGSENARYLPMSSSVHQTLLDWRIQSGLASGRVFTAEDGGRLDAVPDAWTDVLREAELRRFTWEDMRHHFAAKLVLNGSLLSTVWELCGHVDVNTTLRYASIVHSQRSEALEMLG